MIQKSIPSECSVASTQASVVVGGSACILQTISSSIGFPWRSLSSLDPL